MTTPSGAVGNRRFRNLFIAPNKQLRLAFFTMFVALVTVMSFFAFQIWIFTSMIRNLSPYFPESLNVEPMIHDSIRWSWIGFFLGTVFFTVVFGSVSIVISHRIYGPMVAIRRHLAKVLNGEYDHRTHLRKHDEFKDVVEDLNRLSEFLGEKRVPKL